MPETADGDFFREEYEMNYLLGISKVIAFKDFTAAVSPA